MERWVFIVLFSILGFADLLYFNFFALPKWLDENIQTVQVPARRVSQSRAPTNGKRKQQLAVAPIPQQQSVQHTIPQTVPETTSPRPINDKDADASETTRSAQRPSNIDPQPPIEPQHITTPSNASLYLYFTFGKNSLNYKAKNELKRVASMLSERPNLSISLHGHTDLYGADQSNLVLSKKRAENAKDFLISLGVSADRIEIKWYGNNQPLDRTSSRMSQAKNRRVEVIWQ